MKNVSLRAINDLEQQLLLLSNLVPIISFPFAYLFSELRLKATKIKSFTYPTPTVWQKTLMFGPGCRISIEKSSCHHKHPCGQINGIEHMIKYHRFADTQRQYKCHNECYAKCYKVGRFTCKNLKNVYLVNSSDFIFQKSYQILYQLYHLFRSIWHRQLTNQNLSLTHMHRHLFLQKD